MIAPRATGAQVRAIASEPPQIGLEDAGEAGDGAVLPSPEGWLEEGDCPYDGLAVTAG